MLTLEAIADLLDSAQRYGHAPDRRPPHQQQGRPALAADDGASAATDRYIRLSDRMARDIAAALRHHARGESPRAVALERR